MTGQSHTKSYETQIKQRYQYHTQQFDVLRSQVFHQSEQAKRKFLKLAKSKGLEIALWKLQNQPKYFGRLRGKNRLIMKNKERLGALNMLPSLVTSAKRWYLTGTEYKAMLEQKNKVEVPADSLWKSLLSKLNHVTEKQADQHER